MISRTITIRAPHGMHARPAGELVKLVKSYAPTRIRIRTSAKEVDASSILSILSLGLKQGVEAEIVADGEREQEALDAVAEFIDRITD